jgi:ParB-like chromosome segregation protein Spo0J
VPPYQIISGFRRISAIRKIGWKRVHAMIFSRLGDEEALKLCILENEQRKTYTDIDRAHAIQRYRAMGKPVKEIAENIFGLTPRRIEHIESLLHFDRALVNALERGDINTAHAIILNQAKKRNDDMDLSYHKLRRVFKAEGAGRPEEKKPVHLFDEIEEEKGQLSLRFWPAKLDFSSMSKTEARQVRAKLQRALRLVEKVLE